VTRWAAISFSRTLFHVAIQLPFVWNESRRYVRRLSEGHILREKVSFLSDVVFQGAAQWRAPKQVLFYEIRYHRKAYINVYESPAAHKHYVLHLSVILGLQMTLVDGQLRSINCSRYSHQMRQEKKGGTTMATTGADVGKSLLWDSNRGPTNVLTLCHFCLGRPQLRKSADFSCSKYRSLPKVSTGFIEQCRISTECRTARMATQTAASAGQLRRQRPYNSGLRSHCSSGPRASLDFAASGVKIRD
jgi:hypothetical protein